MRKQGRPDYDGFGALVILLLVLCLAGVGVTYALCQISAPADSIAAVYR